MYDFQEDLNRQLVNSLNQKLEDLFINGLKLKGFEFSDKREFEEFIKTRCECIDNLEAKQRIYSVDGIPFFLHNYEPEFCIPDFSNGNCEIKANYGTFAYL